MKTLKQCLIDYDMALLRAIAQRRGVELSSNRRREAAAQLAAALLEPESVAEAVAWLSPAEREALDALLIAGGRMQAALFSRRFGEIRTFGPGRLEREEPWRQPVSPAEGLWYRGLIARAFDLVDEQATEFVFIPTDLRPLLPAPPAGPLPFTVEKVSPPPIVRDDGLAAVQDLCTFLAYLRNQSVVPLRDRSLKREDLARLGPRLLVAEDWAGAQREGNLPRLALLHYLAQRLGLIQLIKGRLQPNPATAKSWLRSAPGQQLTTLQKTWRDDERWNELWRLPTLRCEDTGWRNDPRLARERVLGYLARCPVGEWLSLESFIAAIKRADPDFQRPDGDYRSWYIRDAASGEYLMGFEHWDQVEGALIAHLISGPLRWLGVVALGYNDEAENQPRCFRITPYGAAFLGLASPPPDPEPEPVVITSDLKVRVPLATPLYDRFQLARISEWKASGEEFVYRLTPAALARALSEKVSVEQVLAFLERVSGGQVPPRVSVALRGWAEKFGAVRLRRAVVLQVRKEITLQELRTLPQTASYLVEILSPRAALVKEENWPRLVEELEKLGYLPQVEGLDR
ncbi:MAG: helicase-associated domain-containing protein [Anaerolineae bacterium]|nr:helicase-associated domain-containing protein [Anaerolineae bacterium]